MLQIIFQITVVLQVLSIIGLPISLIIFFIGVIKKDNFIYDPASTLATLFGGLLILSTVVQFIILEFA